jgi:hypothetical protein
MDMPYGEKIGNVTFASSRPTEVTSETNLTDTSSYHGYNETVVYSTCTFNITFVDSHLSCIKEICAVDRMRLKPGDHVLPGFQNLDQGLTETEPHYTSGSATLTERYILDPATAADVGNALTIDMVNVTQSNFTTRFARLVNTYWLTGYAPVGITGGVSHTALGFDYIIRNTTAQWTDTTTVYALNFGWLVGLFICSVLLLLTGIASAIFESLTVGPDVLGFASSIVRQSKYVRIPDSERGGSTIGGAQRARMLGKVEVMMQDVRGNQEVGKIALGTGDENSQRLKHGRLYR